MTMTTNLMSEDKDKNFDVKDNTHYYHIFCDQCEWNRFLNKTIVRVFHGLKPEDEDGIIYDYSEYNYDLVCKSKVIHVHKYNQNMIDAQIRIVLENCKVVNDVKRL